MVPNKQLCYNCSKNCHFVFLLQQFSIDIADNASQVCLAHLFTYQDFDEGTLGLAYVAPSKPGFPGGLCSESECEYHIMDKSIWSNIFPMLRHFVYSKECPPSGNDNRAIYLNTGLTSTKNYGKTILTKASEVQTNVLVAFILVS